MKRTFFLISLLLSSVIMLSLSGCYYDNEEDLYKLVNDQQCDTVNVTFSGTVLPVFNSYCNNCHSTSMGSGGIILDTYAGTAAVINSNRLYGSIAWLSGYSAMPQGGAQLSDCDIKKIKAWINKGFPNN